MKTKSTAIVVRTGVKGGGLIQNHAQAVVVRTGVKAGALSKNHAQTTLASA